IPPSPCPRWLSGWGITSRRHDDKGRRRPEHDGDADQFDQLLAGQLNDAESGVVGNVSREGVDAGRTRQKKHEANHVPGHDLTSKSKALPRGVAHRKDEQRHQRGSDESDLANVQGISPEPARRHDMTDAVPEPLVDIGDLLEGQSGEEGGEDRPDPRRFYSPIELRWYQA